MLKTERAILMGHPNSMAYGAWERAAMHFQPPLKSYFVIPKFSTGIPPFMRLEKSADLNNLLTCSMNKNENRKNGKSFYPKIILEWRYLRHPTNDYCLRAMNVKKTLLDLSLRRKCMPA